MWPTASSEFQTFELFLVFVNICITGVYSTCYAMYLCVTLVEYRGEIRAIDYFAVLNICDQYFIVADPHLL